MVLPPIHNNSRTYSFYMMNDILETSDRDFGRIPPEPNIIPILIDVSQRTANETQRRMANNAITIFVNMTIVTEQAKIFFDIGKEMVPVNN